VKGIFKGIVIVLLVALTYGFAFSYNNFPDRIKQMLEFHRKMNERLRKEIELFDGIMKEMEKKFNVDDYFRFGPNFEDDKIEKEFQNLMKNFHRDFNLPGWMPELYPELDIVDETDIDIKANNDVYKVIIKVEEGARLEDYNINVKNGVLIIKKEKQMKKENKGENYRFYTESSSSYYKSFTLPPDIDSDHMKTLLKGNSIIIIFPRKKMLKKQKPKYKHQGFDTI